MKPTLVILLISAILAAAPATPDITGTWEGTMNDLPAVELILKNDDGRVTGSIGFYFQTRESERDKWHLGEKTTLPLLAPKLEGKVLTFETIHHKKHGSPELGPNNKYRVTFVTANEARLQITNQEPKEGPGLKLTRRQ